MDLVTITDHDSIDGCLEFLDRHPDAADFFISEEIECRLPGMDLRIHVGAYGIDERIHREIQPLRGNVFEALAFLRAEGVFHALNHPFFFFKEQLPLAAYLDMMRLFSAFEVRNGTMLPVHNELTERIVARWNATGAPLTTVGGSDSHTLAGIGMTFTEAPGATPTEFLDSLRAGLAHPGGCHGSAWREAREIYGVVARYWVTLAGAGRPELTPTRRAIGIAFSVVSLPFEFFPLAMAVAHKQNERCRVDAYRREWENSLIDPSLSTAPMSPELQ